jgi:hypothetical protein
MVSSSPVTLSVIRVLVLFFLLGADYILYVIKSEYPWHFWMEEEDSFTWIARQNQTLAAS